MDPGHHSKVFKGVSTGVHGDEGGKGAVTL